MLRRNSKKYLQAWRLRQLGRTYREIGEEMNLSIERVRVMVKFVEFTKNKKIFTKKQGFVALYILKFADLFKHINLIHLHSLFTMNIPIISLALIATCLGIILFSFSFFC